MRAELQPLRLGLLGAAVPPADHPPVGQLPLAGSRLCLYEDGTELTESYFRALPPQTELVLLGPGESWRGCECGAGRGGAGAAPAPGAQPVPPHLPQVPATSSGSWPRSAASRALWWRLRGSC